MSQALILLMSAFHLLVFVFNNPQLPPDIKEQAVKTANYAVQVANHALQNPINNDKPNFGNIPAPVIEPYVAPVIVQPLPTMEKPRVVIGSDRIGQYIDIVSSEKLNSIQMTARAIGFTLEFVKPEIKNTYYDSKFHYFEYISQNFTNGKYTIDVSVFSVSGASSTVRLLKLNNYLGECIVDYCNE